MVKWIAKEINGGSDGIAQIRSDYPSGIKLGDVLDGRRVLIPEKVGLNTDELVKYYSKDLTWCQVKDGNGALIYANPSKAENWIELNNLRSAAPVPEPEPSDEWKEYEYRFENGRLFLKAK